ncbi:T9SS type A sorting domain-containing protein [candidate division WOR-3 bacterium]|nr:T9SS type A sorting domain-containing protein [candidate division WOR-3 bacterium]
MKKLGLFLGILLIPAIIQAGTVTHTTKADFSWGYLDRTRITNDAGGEVQLDKNVGTLNLGWNTSPNSLPHNVEGHICAASGDYIYSIGGKDGPVPTDSVYYAPINLDGSVGTWQATSNLPISLAYLSGGCVNGYIYVVGGHNPGGFYNTVYFAKINPDGTLGSWNSATSLPHNVADHHVGITPEYIYTIGGYDGTAYFDTIYYTTINPDGTIGNWNPTIPTYQPLDDHSVVITNEYLYILGGFAGDGWLARDTVSMSLINEDGLLGAWAYSILPQVLGAGYAVTTGGYIYLTGGCNDSWIYQNTVYYAPVHSNGTLGSWGTTTIMPESLGYHAMAVSNGYIYVLGGADASYVDRNEVYYTQIDTSGVGPCSSGVYISTIIDLSTDEFMRELSWGSSKQTALTMQYRTAPDAGSWSVWSAIDSTSPGDISTSARYLQYRADFTGDGSSTPILEDVTVTYGVGDAGVVSIDSPSDTVWLDSTYSLEASVKNFGTELTETFDVNCVLNGIDATLETTLMPDSTKGLNFGDWTVTSAPATYTMKVKTLLSPDAEPANDSLGKSILACRYGDVGVISIDLPVLDTIWMDSIYPLAATVKNFGNYIENFGVNYKIEYAKKLIDTTVQVTGLKPDSIRQVTFGNWTVEAVDTFIITVTTILPAGIFDLDMTNDVLADTFISVGVEETTPELPTHFSLAQNQPNPFSKTTVVSFQCPAVSDISLRIYDVTGKLVKTLVDEKRKPGSYKVNWNGTNNSGEMVANGVYFYKLQADNFTRTRKLILLK